MTNSFCRQELIVAGPSSRSTPRQVAEAALERLSSFGSTSIIRLNEIPSHAC